MNKFLLIAVGVAILLGGLALGQISGIKSQVSLLASKAGENFGAVVHNVQEQFSAGAKFGRTDQLTISNAGALSTTGALTAAVYNTATIGSSSSSPAALGSAAAGHFVVAASATTANASTTVVTVNSSVYLTQELVTPIAGTTCNTALASGTAVSLITPANGFQIKVQPAPTTNPYCFSYRVSN